MTNNTIQFIKQVNRCDVLTNITKNTHKSGRELFELLMTENGKRKMDDKSSRQGKVFETICQIVIAFKCVIGFHYTEIYDGLLSVLKRVVSVKSLLDIKINAGGHNCSDMTLKNGTVLTPISIKYVTGHTKGDVHKISANNKKNFDKENVVVNVALIVKDKEVQKKHTYYDEGCPDRNCLNEVMQNNLLFDRTDIINALEKFIKDYNNERYDTLYPTTGDFIEFVNAEYLLNPRKQLCLKMHQRMTLQKFQEDFHSNNDKMWCLAHKPRSGKSITILLLCKYLISIEKKKILIMTSVPATIKSFINDLDNYIDFRDIVYITQDKIMTVDKDFVGIVVCSTQYLKTESNEESKKIDKKKILKKIGFDVIITDESHTGSSTEKTKKEIIDIRSEINEVRKNIKISIFASGTADKTIKFYKIKSRFVYEWEMDDETKMKTLQSDADNSVAIDYMTNKHGGMFLECYNDTTVNKDYQACPVQVLMKETIPDSLIVEIDDYNNKNNTSFGYSCGSLFALSKKKIEKSKENYDDKTRCETDKNYKEFDYVYQDEFEICSNGHGKKLFTGFIDNIISNDPNKKTIMTKIEETQAYNKSRISDVGKPLLFIIYLPTHTGNNTISLLQKAIKKFLKETKDEQNIELWTDYNIESSNAVENGGEKEYNDFIDNIMIKTKADKKRGCILLLGNKGSVGITYSDCDVTISLDDGHNLDLQKQRFSRALTEHKDKTVGINVDMNIQRCYTYVADVIHRHRMYTKSTETNAEILKYLFTENIFLFNPQKLNQGKTTSVKIISYYDDESKNMMAMIDDAQFLERIVCDDDMKDCIKMEFDRDEQTKRTVNPELQGGQQNCPKGEREKTEIDGTIKVIHQDGVQPTIAEEQNAVIEDTINKTHEICKVFIPLLAIISRSYKISNFKDILEDEKMSVLLKNLLRDKKIDLDIVNYVTIVKIMSSIINSIDNAEIINNIREIYRIATPDKLRRLIETHFKPTNKEKEDNAEVTTPVSLVDEMLNKIPTEFWKEPKKVLEPCCGKGNFLIGIFDKFYEGLQEKYPIKTKRCQVIIEECLYFGDITTLNTFISTEILKCHILSKTEQKECNLNFNAFVGNSLKLNIGSIFKVEKFNAVIGNPPYNASGATGTGNTIWQDFTKKSLKEWIVLNGYLLFVHPSGWRKPNTARGKFTGLFELMTKDNQMLYLEIHGIDDGKKVFNCGTRYDWYLIERTEKYNETVVIDEIGVTAKLDLSILRWLPNSNIDYIIKNLVAEGDDERCQIIQSMSAYEPRKKWMSHTADDEFKYPCVHSTPKSGTRIAYSKINDKGHFGISKVIFGDSGIHTPVNDFEGKYGMTQHSMGIQTTSIVEGNEILIAIQSKKFLSIIHSCSYSTYAIEWTLFNEFKKDFWREFV
jgi:hypothetical protein